MGTTHGQVFDTFTRLLNEDRDAARQFLADQTRANPHTPDNLRYFAGYCSDETCDRVRRAVNEFTGETAEYSSATALAEALSAELRNREAQSDG